MRNFLLLIVIGFFINSVSAQKVVIEMTDGTTKEGQMDRVTTEMKSYKLKPIDKEGKAQFLKKDSIKTITYYTVDDILVYEKVPIFKNPNNKKIHKQEAMLELLYSGKNITLYIGYKAGEIASNSLTDEYLFCLRPGEKAASMVSWRFGQQINKNTIFRKAGAEYFKDYPELQEKIKNKKYKYTDIMDVVMEYDNWKSGVN